MATQPAPMPIEQYLRTNYRPDADFVDGYIEERHLGEFDHARLQLLISGIIAANEQSWGVTGVVEQRIRVAPTRVRIADLALLHAGAPYEKVTKTPPFLCLEIMSPEDRLTRVKVVLNDYLQMGVEHIWLLDPLRHKTYVFDANGLHEQPGVLSVSGTAVKLDVNALYARLD